MKPETRIRIAVRDNVLKVLDFSVWDMEQNRRTRQTPGFPDLFAVGHGRILFIEIKTAKGTQSPAQKVCEEEITKNGGTYLLWRSTMDAWNWMEAQEIIKREEDGTWRIAKRPNGTQ